MIRRAVRSLDLLLPGLPESVSPAQAPNLHRLLAHAVTGTSPEPLKSVLDAARHPAAGWFAGPFDDPAEHYLLASPVHLRPDMDRLLLFPALAAGVDESDCDALIGILAEHLRDDGIRVHSLPELHSWLLALPDAADMHSTSLYAAAGMNIDRILPAGPRGVWWRQRMTELQMLLHSCAHNEARMQRGRIAANGVWFWGEHNRPQPTGVAGTAAWLDDDARMGFEAFLNDSAQTIWLDDRLMQAGLSLDADHIGGYLSQCDSELFAPLLEALRAGRVRDVSLHDENGRCRRIRRAPGWQFWRRL